MIIFRYGGYDAFRELASAAGFFTVAAVLSAAILLPMLLYLYSMQKALSRCAPENRGLEPGLVWLSLIPLLSIVWNFIVVIKVSESLDAEARSRNLQGFESDPGRGVGLAYCILLLFGWMPYIGLFPALAALVCWIIFWIRISGFSGMLARTGLGPGPA